MDHKAYGLEWFMIYELLIVSSSTDPELLTEFTHTRSTDLQGHTIVND